MAEKCFAEDVAKICVFEKANKGLVLCQLFSVLLLVLLGVFFSFLFCFFSLLLFFSVFLFLSFFRSFVGVGGGEEKEKMNNYR